MKRPLLAVELLVLLVSLFLVASANGPFWRALLAGRNLADAATWRFGAALFVALVALHFAVLCLLATRCIVRPMLALLLVASAAAAHFIQRYGVVLDPSMLRNILHTDPREAAELLSFDLLGSVLLFGLIPASLLWAVRPATRPLGQTLILRSVAVTVAMGVAVGAMLLAYQDFSSLMRNQPSLRYTLTPGNIAWSLMRVLAGDARAAIAARDPPDPAQRSLATSGGRKPVLLVMVIGETARAANFSLNGYARQTNPELAQLEVINFGHATACGTSTEVSLPCMFSPYGRADYDEARIRRHESLLHLLARAGMRVAWLDNQSGCKGVCDGLEFHDLGKQKIPGLCADGHCYDEVLLQGLRSVLETSGGDRVVVLHQLGNHGPAYYRRYPPEMKRFTPVCESAEFRDCTREQIVNAYDNAILYTDRFLAQTIRYLSDLQARFDVALLYVSDHGESLGERGLYLHGLPYAIAPREQLEVPMLWWLPQGSARGLNVDLACLRRRAGEKASHDNLFHSVLGLLAVATPGYRQERDLFESCRTPYVAAAH